MAKYFYQNSLKKINVIENTYFSKKNHIFYFNFFFLFFSFFFFFRNNKFIQSHLIENNEFTQYLEQKFFPHMLTINFKNPIAYNEITNFINDLSSELKFLKENHFYINFEKNKDNLITNIYIKNIKSFHTLKKIFENIQYDNNTSIEIQ